jgi:hypothetical protein
MRSALQNSPGHRAKLRFAPGRWGENFDPGCGREYTSSRLTWAEIFLKPVYLADFTLTSNHWMRDFDLRSERVPHYLFRSDSTFSGRGHQGTGETQFLGGTHRAPGRQGR